MSFGTKLKKLRQDSNMTQEELGKKINTSRSNIANYENDKNMPSVDILEKLAKIFNVSIDYLLGKSDIKNPNKIDINDMDIAFSSGIKGLNKQNQEVLKNIMEGLLAKQEKDKQENKD